MGPKKHLDEARDAAREQMLALVEREASIVKAAIVDDLFGRLSIAIWTSEKENNDRIRSEVESKLNEDCAQYWTGDLWFVDDASPENRNLYDFWWKEGVPVDVEGKLRLNDRHRNRLAWFRSVDKSNAPWIGTPKLVVFHSVKGGMGRTTALAAYAIARARRGETVAIVDFDLDAPGIGRLLDADGEGTTAQWGVIDFLLEAPHELPLDEYMHVCERPGVTGAGRIEVFPAGRIDDSFLTKLARVDLDTIKDIAKHPLLTLLRRIKDERDPHVILVDCRAGLSPAAGLLLSGLAHLHVLFGTTNPQSLEGLKRVVRHLGYEQALNNIPQAECLIVQALVPDNTVSAKESKATYSQAVEDIFRYGYYASEPDEKNTVWSLQDLATRTAPHVPVSLPYRGELAFFNSIDEIADTLMRDPAYAPRATRTGEQDVNPSFCDRLDAALSALDSSEIDNA